MCVLTLAVSSPYTRGVNKVRKLKQVIVYVSCFGCVAFGLYHAGRLVIAEQSGSTPDSASTSRIKTIYDSLVSLSHGSDSAGSWGNWGAVWNRIRSAGEWAPSGDAGETDVASGKKFYKDSRTQKTGTASLAQDFSQQSLQDWDDKKAGDTTVEEAVWTNTAGSATTGVWKDTRTGLYWSVSQGYKTNLFTRTTCDFFTTTPRGAYTGTDADCGNAINACGLLSLEAVTGGGAKTDWYLPSIKELQQAIIDGIYNQNSSFTTTEYFWSSTENSDDASSAWNVNLTGLTFNYFVKSYVDFNAVRCVRRD